MTYRIVDRPAFEAVGWAHRTVTVDGQNMISIPQFWDRCHAEGKVASLAPLGGPLGFLGLCAEMDMKDQSFTYFIAVEKQPGATYPEGTRTYPVPAATYVVFSAVGAMPHAIQDVWKAAYSEWFPSSGFEHAGTADFEVYPAFPEGDERGDPASPKGYSEVWIPLRKKP